MCVCVCVCVCVFYVYVFKSCKMVNKKNFTCKTFFVLLWVYCAVPNRQTHNILEYTLGSSILIDTLPLRHSVVSDTSAKVKLSLVNDKSH